MSDLTRRPPDPPAGTLATTGPVVDWSRLSDGARETLSEFSYSAESRRSYAWAWSRWIDWTATTPGKNGEARPAMPASPFDVADYLDHLSRQTREDTRTREEREDPETGELVPVPGTGKRVPVSASLVELAAASIACAHLVAGVAYDRRHPAIRTMLRAIRRKLGTAPRRQRDALVAELVARVVEPLSDDRLIDVRDRAVTLVAFFSGRRRSTLSTLDMDAIAFGRDGLDITIRRSKTNQEGKPESVSLPLQGDARLCPVRTLRAWLDRAGIEHGPVFRAVDRWENVGDRLAGQEINRIVAKLCERAGLPGDDWGAHSTRAGIITTLDERGFSLTAIGEHVGQKDMNTTARYVRRAGRFRRNPARDIFGGGK